MTFMILESCHITSLVFKQPPGSRHQLLDSKQRIGPFKCTECEKEDQELILKSESDDECLLHDDDDDDDDDDDEEEEDDDEDDDDDDDDEEEEEVNNSYNCSIPGKNCLQNTGMSYDERKCMAHAHMSHDERRYRDVSKPVDHSGGGPFSGCNMRDMVSKNGRNLSDLLHSNRLDAGCGDLTKYGDNSQRSSNAVHYPNTAAWTPGSDCTKREHVDQLHIKEDEDMF
ncbi:hypothetical protein Hamer_G006742 [Homarus americanus]|uniref:Uncharacterized protein n=1 Tax=Homarus americanus TaxID=6706 RepID=A0A8J5MMB0_HOMAM|nr:hypothetical protein Hamer_G006742 [Homarus americanus]